MPIKSKRSNKTVTYNPERLKNKPGVFGRKFLNPLEVSEANRETGKERKEQKRRQKKLAAQIRRYESLQYQKKVAEDITRYRTLFYLDY